MKFSISEVTTSQNAMHRMHWAVRHKMRDRWYWLVRTACGVTPEYLGGHEIRPAYYHLHLVRVATRLLDDQNVPAGTKYLVDALAYYGHIYRDSRKWLRLTFDQRKCDSGEEPHMEITIRRKRSPEWEKAGARATAKKSTRCARR